MATERSGATRAGYVIALVLLILGIVISGALIVYLIINIFSIDEDMQRVIVPGTAELELEVTGRYTIFYEYRTTVDGQDFRTDETPPNLRIEVRDVGTDERIPVSSAFGSANYTLWNRAGESIASFRVDEPGTYEIAAEYADDPNGEDIVLALGEGIGTSILLSVGAGIGAGLVFCTSFLIAFIVIVITLIRRSRGDQQTRTQRSSVS